MDPNSHTNPNAQPNENKGEDLMLCPICYGHTKLLGGYVYCPHDNLIISTNVSDSLKTKVELIKEQVGQQKAVTEYNQTTKKRVAHSILGSIVLVGMLVGGFLFIMTFYPIVQAAGYERAGDYQKAETSYEKSEWIITLPGVQESIARTMRLAYSEQQYQFGQQAFDQKNWSKAIDYFNLVEKDDRNYEQAQLSIKIAQTNVQQH